MYEKFEWEDRYNLNVMTMDSEHKVLIKKMNHLSAACKESDPNLKEIFDDFAKYVEKHFLSEEEYMQSIGFPDLNSHKLIHQNLLEKVGTFKSQLESSGSLDDEFFKFLKFWLSSHICGIDMKYSKFTNN